MFRFAFALCCMFLLATTAFSKAETVRVAAYDLSPYISRDRNEKGYLYDIVSEVFSRLGYKLDIEFFPAARAKALVESGERDLLIPAYSTPDDAAKLIFSQPIHGSQIGYIQLEERARSRSGMQDVETANSKNIAQLRDATAHIGAFTEEGKVIHSSSDRLVQLIDMLARKRIKLAVADKFQIADVLVNSRPHLIGKIRFVAPALVRKDFHLAAGRKKERNVKLIQAFDKGLLALQTSGEYQAILMRYGYQSKASDSQTLNVATVINSDMNIMEEMSEHFIKKFPGTKINWIKMEENILRRRVLSSIVLEDGFFDVVTIGNYDSAIYASNGWIEALQPPPSYHEEDLIGVVKDGLSTNGRLYALPFYAESSMTYYRSDLFQKAGIKMPEFPSYGDIRSFAQKIHDPAHGIYGICLRGKPGWGENMSAISSMVNVFGGRWFNDKWEPQIQSKAWAEVLDYYTDILKKYGPPDAHKNGYVENLKLFADGHCGIWIDATVGASVLLNRQQSSVASTTAFARSPTMKTKEGGNWLWTWALAVMASSKKKQLAEDFITWATSEDYIKLVAKERSWLDVPPGTRRSTHNNPNYLMAAPFSSFVLSQIESAHLEWTYGNGMKTKGIQFVEIPEFTAVGTSVGIFISKVLEGKMSKEQALEKAQQEVRSIMNHSGRFRRDEVTSER